MLGRTVSFSKGPPRWFQLAPWAFRSNPRLNWHQVHILLLPPITKFLQLLSRNNTNSLNIIITYSTKQFTSYIHCKTLLRKPEYRRNEFTSLAANPPRCGPNRSLCSFHLSRCIVRNFKPAILPVCFTRTPKARQATTRSSGSRRLDGPAPKNWKGSPNIRSGGSSRDLLACPCHEVCRVEKQISIRRSNDHFIFGQTMDAHGTAQIAEREGGFQ